jgi:ABC-type nitrate/sulfonate/bicarbonate transport system, ATPase component
MINAKDIEVYYGQEKALNKIFLSIQKNSTCAVIGPSGCGKTTLLYALSGIIKPSSGKVFIDGQELKGIRENTGLILQDYGLLPWKNVWDNIAFPLRTRGFKKAETDKRVSSIIKDLGLEEHIKKFPGELSGGQKQRVAIGRTLALRPDLLLLDEASSALDAITREHIQNLILDIYKKEKLTLILVTHNIEEAVFLGQRIIVMEKGTIKHVIDNPLFGTQDLRNKLDFYKLCIEVRKWLDEENQNSYL